MTSNQKSFIDINKYLTDISLTNKKLIKVTEINKVKISICKKTLTLNNILYISELNRNFLSIETVR